MRLVLWLMVSFCAAWLSLTKTSYCLLHVVCWVFGHPVVFGDCFQCLLVIIDEIVFFVIIGEIGGDCWWNCVLRRFIGGQGSGGGLKLSTCLGQSCIDQCKRSQPNRCYFNPTRTFGDEGMLRHIVILATVSLLQALCELFSVAVMLC